MFVLSVIDYNGQKLDLLKCRSQKEIDSFTTCFEDSDTLIKKLGLDESFDVEISEYLKKTEEPVILPFIGSKYRNVIYNYNNDEYIRSISSLPRNVLKSFFYNELLFQQKNDTAFSDTKQKTIKKIHDLLDQIDKDYREKLVNLLSSYFKDYYSAFKSFYKYIINFTKVEPLKYPLGTKEKCLSDIKIMREIIVGRKNPIEKEIEFEDEADSIVTNPLSDIDSKVNDLDMFLDQKGISNQNKKELIDKKIKKI